VKFPDQVETMTATLLLNKYRNISRTWIQRQAENHETNEPHERKPFRLASGK